MATDVKAELRAARPASPAPTSRTSTRGGSSPRARTSDSSTWTTSDGEGQDRHGAEALDRDARRVATPRTTTGHAIVAKLLPKTDPVHKVTISAAARWAPMQLPEQDR